MRGKSFVFISGNLTRDPKLRYTPGGTALCEFSVAVNEVYGKNDDGTKKERVTFVEVQAWTKLAEVVAQYCSKGRSVAVLGSLRQDRWDDKTTGKGRSKLYVNADSVQFLSSPMGNKGNSNDKGDDEYAPDEADQKTGKNHRGGKRRK